MTITIGATEISVEDAAIVLEEMLAYIKSGEESDITSESAAVFAEVGLISDAQYEDFIDGA